ncbi:MAG: carbon storage regulator [Desulfurellales bacterium]|nr:MAG: carbon storage regulator [Desulfurellales bacterium]
MLVLMRRLDEQIIIDEQIVITITEISGDKVRLGIDAPSNVSVDRMEVHLAKHARRIENAVPTVGDGP